MRLFRDDYDLVLAERLRRHPFLVCVAILALSWSILILWAQHPWEDGSWSTTGFYVGLTASMLCGALIAYTAIRLVGNKARSLDKEASSSNKKGEYIP